MSPRTLNQRGPNIGDPPPAWRRISIPLFTVIFASALPTMLPLISNSPVVPPMGLLLFLCWQLLRTDIWPIWIGAPLGLMDDLFSGAPIGSAIFLWTVASFAIHYFSERILWRAFWHDWLIAALLIALIQTISAKLSHSHAAWLQMLQLVAPQIIISSLLFPLFMRLTAMVDKFRLKRG
jgi:rod shape-determining protein MreD